MKAKIVSFIAGLIWSVVFGIVDNAFLWLGMDNNPWLPASEDPILSGMYGNLFSDFWGAIIAMLVSYIFLKLLKVKPSEHILIEIIGVTIGCLIPIGIYLLF